MIIESFHELIVQIGEKPWVSLGVVLNLILIESLLSIDNAAVLATIVLDLPIEERPKALRYGLLGAYAFRGLALLFAAVLISVWWVKPLGGLYLLYLALDYFVIRKRNIAFESPEEEITVQKKSWIYRKTLGYIGKFWATVILVELMDLAFSIDNVVAANAYSKNLLLVWTGVFIGILAMRYAAGLFLKMMEKFPFLEISAFAVIAMLGVKLSLSGFTHFYPCSDFAIFLEGNAECLVHQGLPEQEGVHKWIWGDVLTSGLSLGFFLVPVVTSLLFNRPRHRSFPEEK